MHWPFRVTPESFLAIKAVSRYLWVLPPRYGLLGPAAN